MANSPIDTILKLKDHPLKLSDLIRIARKLDMSQIQMAMLADISLRTFKSKTKSSLLSFHISERVLMLENLYQIGLDVFDSNESSFHDWLKSKIPALDNHVPNDLLTSLLGIDVVKEELLRIEHGIY
jgi:putative toxin-antitoxin system antitoxin component (TIGR02293 family)